MQLHGRIIPVSAAYFMYGFGGNAVSGIFQQCAFWRLFMTRYFTHFWPHELCEGHYLDGYSGAPLSFTAGSGFLAKHVTPGDYVYIISVHEGSLRLLGRFEVGRIMTSFEEAKQVFGPDVEEAAEYALPMEHSATGLHFTRGVDWQLAGELRFISLDDKPKPLKFAGHEKIDAGMLTGVREITPSSAALLDRLIDQPFEDPLAEPAPAEDVEIDDNDLNAILSILPRQEQQSGLRRAAISYAVREFEAAGWTVEENNPDQAHHCDLVCRQNGHELFLAVVGIEHDEMVFTLSELQYFQAVRDSHYAICVVRNLLKKRPTLVTLTSEDLEDFFDARPLDWVFRPRQDDFEDFE
jgi:hypothetical protein